jgi:RNA polymerase sigma-70 factor (ECF subfamily)
MSDSTERLQFWLDRVAAGDDSARTILVERSQERLRKLARRMLDNFQRLRRWEDTDDITQRALVKLHRALETVKPATVREYLGLAATQIRRVLIDLSRQYFGQYGLANWHESDKQGSSKHGPLATVPTVGEEPQSLEAWTEFHENVARLPTELREVFDLLWYHGLTHEEAAEILDIPRSVLRRRWIAARNSLGECGDDDMLET